MLLTREQIIGADDRKTVDVEVPEWGGTVRLRGMSGAERDEYEAGIISVGANGSREVNLKNMRARLVAFSCIDEAGEHMFSADDVSALGEKSAAALERVFDVARKLSGLADADVEELAAGFTPAPSDGSTSG
jgi:hypothetical protein